MRIYSVKSNGNEKLSAHFSVREFAEPGTDEVKIDAELIRLLELLYARLECSKIVITSGYRTDNPNSQHAKGHAADVNCWHIVNGKQVRYQGKEILLAAEDVGFHGIGWIPGSTRSRAAVHLDTRGWRYFFDEANHNRSIGDSWYTFFGLPNPGSPSGCPFAAPKRVIRLWSIGKDVKWVQWLLSEVHGYKIKIDGIYGQRSRDAVKSVQRAAGIAVDGVVGKNTRQALDTASKPYKCPYVEPVLVVSMASKGEEVKWVQWHLKRSGYNISIDGVFGEKTLSAVQDMQKKEGIFVDGMVGWKMRKALKRV